MTLIEQIKAKLSLLDVVKLYPEHAAEVAQGKDMIRCPFHGKDSNPSLKLNLHNGTFHCFGCGVRGDMIDFYERKETISSSEAISRLARMAEIPSQKRPEMSKESQIEYRAKKVLLEALKAHQRHFWTPGSAAYSYMRKRGFSDDILKAFSVGVASENSFALLQFISQAGMTEEEAVRFGLLSQSSKGVRYDPMFGRIVFPITLANGHVIAFGGRNYKSDTQFAKYMNSANSPLFSKSGCLFGLSKAAQAIRSVGEAIVVEGYMDVLAMHQAGFTNTLGTMGTAITPDQVNLLKGICHTIIFFHDGDPPGRQASIQAAELAIRANMQSKVVSPPEGEDPDSLFTSHGVSELTEMLQTSNDGVSIWLQALETRPVEEQARVVHSIITSYSNPLVKVIWAKRFGEYLGVKAQELLDACAHLEEIHRAETQPLSSGNVILQ